MALAVSDSELDVVRSIPTRLVPAPSSWPSAHVWATDLAAIAAADDVQADDLGDQGAGPRTFPSPPSPLVESHIPNTSAVGANS